MDHWFSVIAAGCELPAHTVEELDDVGVVVIAGPVAPLQLSGLAAVYDAAVSAADPTDAGGGRTTTRVWDFVYNGSVWHGHGVNQTREPRRSIQGAYIRRDDKQGTNQAARMRPETLGRIGALAKYVLNLESQLPVPDAHA